MDMVMLFPVAFMVLALVIRLLGAKFRPCVEIVVRGGRVRVILYYMSRDGEARKRVMIC